MLRTQRWHVLQWWHLCYIMVVPFGFEAVAQQTVASFLVLAFLGEEAPVDGDSAGVAHDGLDHAPKQHGEEDVEDDEQDDVWGRFEPQQVLEHVHEVVEGDEHDDPDEVRVDELAATQLAITHSLGRLLFEYYYISMHPAHIPVLVPHSNCVPDCDLAAFPLRSISCMSAYYDYKCSCRCTC